MTIKTIAFILIMQFINSNLMAVGIVYISDTDKKTRPGDGKDKYNPHAREGESLKGYFYRAYGDQRVLAKNVKIKGPFKRRKVKHFLKICQLHDGYVSEAFTKVKEKKSIRTGYRESKTLIVHHITLQTKVDCLVDGESITSRKWAAVYLDSDKDTKYGENVYIDYDDCDSDNRAYLEIGEYSIHYDQNPKCRADLSEISIPN